MKLKPITNSNDLKRILKNGDLKMKTIDDVVKLMDAKNFSEEEKKDVLKFCQEKEIKFARKRRSSTKQATAVAEVQRRMKPSTNFFSIYGAHLAEYALLTEEEEKVLARKIVKGRKARAELDFLEANDVVSKIPFADVLYLEDIYNKSIMDMMDEYKKELTTIANVGTEAREEFINCNLRLSYSIAKKHKASGISLEDLIQEGNIGLMKAVDKYDPERGFRFATMASWWIEQAISRGIANKSRTIRVPVHIWEKTQKIRAFERKFEQTHGTMPEIEDYAEFLGTSTERATEIVSSMAPTASLDKEIASKKREGLVLADMVDDKKNTEDILEKKYLKDAISEILDDMNLDETERGVFVNRFGLEDNTPKTMNELESMFKIKTSQINKIISKIVTRFKTPDRVEMLKDFYATI